MPILFSDHAKEQLKRRRIPQKLAIFTGVLGSGKSSIVFDTIATEAKRQEYETFSMIIRGLLPKYSHPMLIR